MKRYERASVVHEYLRLAAFALVRRHGPAALTRRALAAELGISDSVVRGNLGEHVALATLAASACEVARRPVAFRRDPTATPAERIVSMLLPVTDEDVDVALVWWRLVLAHGARPPEDDPDGGSLRSRFQVSVRGWSDDPSPDELPANAPAPDSTRVALARYLADHDEGQRGRVSQLVGTSTWLVEPVLALVDGLVLAVVTGRLAPGAARLLLLEHLTLLDLEVGDPAA